VLDKESEREKVRVQEAQDKGSGDVSRGFTRYSSVGIRVYYRDRQGLESETVTE
jgi:hypothetical protein